MPPAVRELEDVLAPVLVHALAQLAPERNPFVAVDRGVAGHDEAAPVDAAPRRDDRADAAPREAELPVDPRPQARAVVVVEAPGKARAEEPVLDLEAPEPERGEDRVGYGDGRGGGSKTERICATIASCESKRLSS